MHQSPGRSHLPPPNTAPMASSRFDGITEEEIRRIEGGVSANDVSHTESFCSPQVMSSMQRIITEAIGTFFIVFAGCGSVAVNKMDGSITFPGICITWGLIVMVMIYSVGHISGGHFNPAVTITFTILRRFPLKESPLYVFAQLVGATIASGALFLLLNPSSDHFFGTVPVGSAMQSFVFEIIISFLLMFVISGVATDARARGEFAGVVVGSTILLNVFIAGPISGASMNPARSIGPAIIMRSYKDIWVYIFGPIIGTLLGGLVYNIIRVNDKHS